MDPILILAVVNSYKNKEISYADASLLLLSYGLIKEQVEKLLKE